MIVDLSIGEETEPEMSPKAKAGRLGGLRGGKARADNFTPEERSGIAKRRPPSPDGKSDGEDEHAPVHAVDERLLEKGGEPHARDQPALHVFQLLPHPQNFAVHARDDGTGFTNRLWEISYIVALVPEPAAKEERPYKKRNSN